MHQLMMVSHEKQQAQHEIQKSMPVNHEMWC
jgi:hypothetical protein